MKREEELLKKEIKRIKTPLFFTRFCALYNLIRIRSVTLISQPKHSCLY